MNVHYSCTYHIPFETNRLTARKGSTHKLDTFSYESMYWI